MSSVMEMVQLVEAVQTPTEAAAFIRDQVGYVMRDRGIKDRVEASGLVGAAIGMATGLLHASGDGSRAFALFASAWDILEAEGMGVQA